MVKDIVPRPHMADRLADLMGLSAEDLLQLTESYTLGYFIRNGEKEIVEKIAKSHHKDKSAFDLCMERKNLGPILAYLLSQPMSDPETTIQGLLTHVDPSFGEISIDELFKTEPIAVAVELLKALADAGDNTQRAAAVCESSASGIIVMLTYLTVTQCSSPPSDFRASAPIRLGCCENTPFRANCLFH